jgi:hypothetical protein
MIQLIAKVVTLQHARATTDSFEWAKIKIQLRMVSFAP